MAYIEFKDIVKEYKTGETSVLAPMANRLIRFRSGEVIEEKLNPQPTPIQEIEW